MNTLIHHQHCYDSILSNSEIPVYTETIEGVIDSWGLGAATLYDFSSNEIIGKNGAFLCPEKYKKELLELRKTVQSGAPVQNFRTTRLSGNKQIDVSISVNPIFDAEKNVTGFLTFTKEIQNVLAPNKFESDLQKSLKEISDYKYALDESSIVAITDQKGIIKHVNQNFCKISKFSADELIGQDHRIINSSYHSKEFIRNIWVTIANGKIWRGELKNKTKDGNFYWVDTTIVPFLNEFGKPYQYVAIRSDITSRKLAEQEIKKLNEELEERVSQRTSELEMLNKELESFSYSISHDLRAPLRAINGYSFRVQKKLEDTIDEEGKVYLEKIVSNTKRMGQLVDDLLSFSRLGREEVVKMPFSMENLVNQIISEIKQENAITPAKLNVKISENAPGDYNMLRQVWVNLINNALKYSSHNKQITIEIGCYKEKRNIVYYIKDNGVGFDMNYVNKLFGVFQRLHSKEEFEGEGVGLAVVKKIIQKHGGTVWAEGKVDEGATFYFTLPKD